MDTPVAVVRPPAQRSHARFILSRSSQPSPSPSFPRVADAAPRLAVPGQAHRPKLLDQVREAIRTRHYSLRTESAYVGWIKRFIFFHGKRHPIAMGAKEVGQFLSALAVQKQVSAATQSQALSALLFLYREVLD